MLSVFFFFLQLIPINHVSLLGGKLFQILGPFTKSHKIAVSNYKKVYPHLKAEEIKKQILKSWNNLGKTFIELSILEKILNEKNKKIQISGTTSLNNIKNKKERVIFFGIHQANWELIVPVINKLGISVGAVYRHINNPYIDKYILKIRSNTILNSKTFYSPKGKESAKEILKAINQGLSMVILIDQKDSAGNTVKFFNHDAKTQLGFLKIARKYNLKIIPIQIIRKKINNFSIIFHNPLNPFQTEQSDILAMSTIHKMIEKWISENPNQWFWQHKRFS